MGPFTLTRFNYPAAQFNAETNGFATESEFPTFVEPDRDIEKPPEHSDDNNSTLTWIKVGSATSLGVSDNLFLDRNRDISLVSPLSTANLVGSK